MLRETWSDSLLISRAFLLLLLVCFDAAIGIGTYLAFPSTEKSASGLPFDEFGCSVFEHPVMISKSRHAFMTAMTTTNEKRSTPDYLTWYAYMPPHENEPDEL